MTPVVASQAKGFQGSPGGPPSPPFLRRAPGRKHQQMQRAAWAALNRCSSR